MKQKVEELKKRITELEKLEHDWKETEKALEFSRKEYQTLFNEAGDAIFYLNFDGTIRDINKKACEIFGYSREEILNMHNLELVASEYRDDSYDRLQKLLDGDTLDPYEKMFEKKSGEKVPVEINISVITDENGKPSYLQSIVRDITFRVKAEKQQDAIYNISKAAIATKSLDELFKSIHDSLSAVIDTTNFFIAMYDRETDYITFPYFVDQMDSDVPVLKASEIDTGTTKIIKSGKPLFNTEKDIHEKIKSGDIDLVGSISKVWLGVPLKMKGEVIGVIAVQSYNDPYLYTEKDIPLLEVVADNIATVISRKIYEEKLSQKEKFLKDVFDAIQDGISILDIDLNIVRVNRTMEEKYKQDLPFVGEKCYKVYQQRNEPCPWCPTLQTLQTGENHVSIIPYPAIGDPLRWSELSTFPLKDTDGVITGVIEYVKDITDRKKAEEQIRESEKKYRTLVENAPVGILYADINGKIIDANKKMLEILGSPELIETKKINMLSYSDLIDAGISENFQKCLDTGDLISAEAEYRSKWGQKVYVRYHFTPIQDNENRIGGIQGLIEDITQIKKRDEEKKELEEQLFQSQKMESIGRLAGGIAHDFNNILTGIMGFAELLKIKYPETDSTEGHAANIIFNGTERAAELTKQLLGFARGGKYNPVVLNINEVLMETVRVSEKIFEKNIHVAFDFSDTIKLIEADKPQLIQVFTNLFINAKDAMPHGGKLHIKTENCIIDYDYSSRYPEFSPGEYVKISVTDSGIGMTKDVKDSIFEPFFTTKGEGTGLGLATVYGIVKNHHGHISVYSEPGQGTIFALYFPLSEKILEIEETKEEYYSTGDATILVIDDESHVRIITEHMLKTLGYTVLLAEDGKRGLKLFKKQVEEIDLVLLDMVMPNMAGKETYLEMRKIKPDVKVLLASGFSQNGKANEILNEGVLGFIQKPFKIQELSTIVSQILTE
ncbi:PAS domain S-box protein [candidate division KSB1 bacterium]